MNRKLSLPMLIAAVMTACAPKPVLYKPNPAMAEPTARKLKIAVAPFDALPSSVSMNKVQLELDKALTEFATSFQALQKEAEPLVAKGS